MLILGILDQLEKRTMYQRNYRFGCGYAERGKQCFVKAKKL